MLKSTRKKVVKQDLYKGEPYKPLTEGKKRGSGRNNDGRISVRHKGGGHKRRYRVIDFRQVKVGITAIVERIEYDPNRTAHIALLKYADGARRYILAAKGMKVGDKISASTGKDDSTTEQKPGNTLELREILEGTAIYCIELKPGKGGQLCRSAGASAQLQAKEGDYAQIKLPSGEVRKVLLTCRATIGEASNSAHNLVSIGKAGRKRWLGVRPTVRGVVMNPVDHPHGGGEGRTSGGRHPVSPWGVPTKGYKTRKNKRTSKLIVRRRKKRK